MKKLYILLLGCIVSMGLMTSCGNDDEFTDTIFPTDGKPYDPNAATADFDKWIYDNFLTPYNTAIDYRMYFPASNLNYQLTPADYDKSVLLAQLIRYLFYDVYTGQQGHEFMRMYAPRQFHFIGSVAYSATTGTETLGYASGGVKITLLNCNVVNPSRTWGPYDLYNLNHYIFHTMHHEFSHILQQTKVTPTSFRLVTPSAYDANGWQDRDSLTSHAKGFVTNYASSSASEDFVEVLSSIITDNDGTWMHRIINASVNGFGSGDKEQILTLVDSLHIENLDDPAKDWNQIKIYKDFDVDGADMGYSTNLAERYGDEKYDHREEVEDLEPMTFREFLDWVTVDNALGNIGITAMLKKIDIATNDWYVPEFGLYVYSLREDLDKRQNNLPNFLQNDYIMFPLVK